MTYELMHRSAVLLFVHTWIDGLQHQTFNQYLFMYSCKNIHVTLKVKSFAFDCIDTTWSILK